ncbi:hypothetical protein GYA13_00630 [Candidatus Kuenenbacteria bacterium]|nr:hypothetical protein [Candidatus Kuenenbacteria bacterium]
MTETCEQFIKRKNKNFKIQKGRLISMKDIGRSGRFYFIREAWTFIKQHNLKEKIFIIERLRKEKTEGKIIHKKSWSRGEIEYRIGYYIVGKIGRAKDKWIWGQFCPLIPEKDLKRLFVRITSVVYIIG